MNDVKKLTEGERITGPSSEVYKVTAVEYNKVNLAAIGHAGLYYALFNRDTGEVQWDTLKPIVEV